MIYKKHKNLLFLIAISCLFSIVLQLVRIYVTGTTVFIFLIWNLFLAFIPFVVSLATENFTNKTSKIKLYGYLAVWLLFFPNAHYIITDFFHLKWRDGVPLWYDLTLLFSFAWNGLILGYVSLMFIHNTLNQFFGTLTAWFMVLFSLFLAAFGIYLGRYLRLNSWDIFTNPIGIFVNILDRFLHPFTHKSAWAFVVLVATFLILGYLTLQQLLKLQIQENTAKL